MNKKWTNDTHRLLNDAQYSAPEGLLGDIKKEMARRGLQPAYGQRKAHIISMCARRWGAVAASVAVVAAIGVCLMPPHQQEPQQPLTQQTVMDPGSLRSASLSREAASAMAPTTQPVASVSEWVAQAVETVAKSRREAESLVAQHEEAACAPSDPPVVAMVDASQEPVCVAEEHAEERVEPRSSVQPRTKARQQQDVRTTRDITREPELQAHASRSRAVEVGAHLSGMPSMNLSGMAGGRYSDLCYTSPFDTSVGETGTTSVPGLGHAKSTELRSKHHQPVKVGFSVRVPLGHRWSLQTGLNYAYLKSDFEDSSNGNSITGSQALHYIGVPIGVSYDVWSNRRFNVYATAGGEMEKLVKGTFSTDNSSEKVKESRPVLSLNVAAGIALKLSPMVSFYAEPGLSCHFKNGSGVESSYTDHPLGFSLNVGLRLNTK